MECPICYNAIALEDEAYVGSCYHRFCHKCITNWTAQQRQHPILDADGRTQPDYRCPMCKQHYSCIIYDCVLSSFQIEYVDDAAKRVGRAAAAGGLGMALSASHRRRRALYIKAPQTAQEQEGGQQQQPNGGQTCREASFMGAGGRRRLAARANAWRHADDPEVTVFLKRELQAVLLQEDVGLVLQHVLGVLRGLGEAGRSSGSGRGTAGSAPVTGTCASAGGGAAGAPGLVGRGALVVPQNRNRFVPQAKRARTEATGRSSQQDFEARVSREAALFLTGDSDEFARQCFLFMSSGLSVKAYDELVFEPGLARAEGQDGTGGGGSGGGEGAVASGVDEWVTVLPGGRVVCAAESGRDSEAGDDGCDEEGNDFEM